MNISIFLLFVNKFALLTLEVALLIWWSQTNFN